MQADTNLFVWMMRLQQTEALVHKRREELQAHQQRRHDLEAVLVAEEAQTVLRMGTDSSWVTGGQS